jgi:hypothetical protein
MLTGLEQYYWEKAGYFIRRQALSPEEVSSCLKSLKRLSRERRTFSIETLPAHCLLAMGNPTVLGIIKDLLEPGRRFHHAALQANVGEERIPGTWTRDMLPEGNPLQAQDAVLQRHQGCLTIRLAFSLDESLHVVPGSYVSPLPPEQIATLTADPHSDLEGAVCMRLAPGDALFYNPNLIHRTEINPAVSTCALEYAWVAHHHPFAAALPTSLKLTPIDRLLSAVIHFFS